MVIDVLRDVQRMKGEDIVVRLAITSQADAVVWLEAAEGSVRVALVDAALHGSKNSGPLLGRDDFNLSQNHVALKIVRSRGLLRRQRIKCHRIDDRRTGDSCGVPQTN